MLSVTRLSKTYADGTRALRNLSVEVEGGRILVLLGASGCGKSSLLRIIAGLERCDTGTLSLDGKPLNGPHPDINVVFQEPRLLPWLTAAENVGFGLGVWSKPRREAAVAIMLERIGLAAQGRKLPRDLSGGQQQRLALARALASCPKVLLLDEPFSALDAMTREGLQDVLLGMWKSSGTTIVMVTHDLDEALYLGDRIAVMLPDPGRLAEVVDIDRREGRRRDDPASSGLKRHLRALLEGGRTLVPERGGIVPVAGPSMIAGA